jgi:hypothetical protein
MSALKVFVGCPMRRFDALECHRDLMRWLDSKHETRVRLELTYGVDIARSNLITDAKEWGADILLMVDSDVIIETPIHETLSMVRQDFSRGYSMIISPSISSTRQIMVWAPEGEEGYDAPSDIPFDSPTPVDWAALGFCAIRGEDLGKLKALAFQNFVNAPPRPLYCTYSATEGEDRSLCRNLRASTGRLIGVDGRIWTSHMKLAAYKSWRGENGAVRQS